jgi:hypothetical protein
MLPVTGAPTSMLAYPYTSSSWLCEVYDVNEDGFEDAIMFQGYFSFTYNCTASDVYIWLNPNTATAPLQGFLYSNEYAKLILREQALSHTCQLCDADMDGTMEFIVSAVSLNPYNDTEDVAKFAYYFNLNQSLDQFGIYPVPTSFPFWIFIPIGIGGGLIIVIFVLVKRRNH